MATRAQLKKGLDFLKAYEFNFEGTISPRYEDYSRPETEQLICSSTPPVDRATFVSQMLARKGCCTETENDLREFGASKGLLCRKPYSDLCAEALSKVDERFPQYTIFVSDEKGPCGMVEFNVSMDTIEEYPTLPVFFLTLDLIVLSEDRRDEGLGSEMAICAAETMFNVVSAAASAMTKRGVIEIFFQSSVVSISGWCAASAASTFLAEGLGLKGDAYSGEGKVNGRTIMFMSSVED